MGKYIGLELLPLKEGQKIKVIKPEKSLKEWLNEQKKNHPNEFIKRFFGSKNFELASKEMDRVMHLSLPENISENCPKCMKGNNKGYYDSNCSRYNLQMSATYLLAATEFVNIVLRHRHILENKKFLLELTNNFFNCFIFLKGQGKMFFDLEKLHRYTLNAGFLSISAIIANSEVLQSLDKINDTLGELEDKETQNKVLQREDEDYIDLQKEFFFKKQRLLKEKIFIKKEKEKELKTKQNINSNKKKPSIPQYVLYYYYLQKSGDFGYFENHPEGKVKAISELIQKESLNTTAKYFQMKYNFISNYNSNRIAKNQEANINYVANIMLSDFPKAQKLALYELKEAQTKNR